MQAFGFKGRDGTRLRRDAVCTGPEKLEELVMQSARRPLCARHLSPSPKQITDLLFVLSHQNLFFSFISTFELPSVWQRSAFLLTHWVAIARLTPFNYIFLLTEVFLDTWQITLDRTQKGVGCQRWVWMKCFICCMHPLQVWQWFSEKNDVNDLTLVLLDLSAQCKSWVII